MKKILIAEDDFFIRDVYSRAFSSAGYEVASVSDGTEALDVVHNTAYDLILLDIMMPKTDGIEVLRTIRQIPSISQHTPIFMLTNLGQDDVIKKAFSLGADGYLLKAQLKPKDIVREIDNYFRKKEDQSSGNTGGPTNSSPNQQ